MYQRIQFDIHLRQHKKHTVCLCVVLKPQEVEKLIERITAYRVSSSLRDTASKLQGILQFLIFKCLKVQEAEAGSAKNKQTKDQIHFKNKHFYSGPRAGNLLSTEPREASEKLMIMQITGKRGGSPRLSCSHFFYRISKK